MARRTSMAGAGCALVLVLSTLVAAARQTGNAAAVRGTSTVLAATAQAGRPPVIGSRRFAAPYGSGWGRVRPRRLDNGGVPSGIIFRIRWRRWGGPRAVGRGLSWVYRPHGGYYNRPGKIVLRVERLGRCGNGARAYTRLKVRTVRRPGGKLRRGWHSWSGTDSLCRPMFG